MNTKDIISKAVDDLNDLVTELVCIIETLNDYGDDYLEVVLVAVCDLEIQEGTIGSILIDLKRLEE